MASTQKNPPKRGTAAKSSPASKPRAQGKKKVPPAKKKSPTVLWERISIGVFCFLLSMFLTLNLFGIEALVIDFIGAGVKGSLGYGFFLTIPSLLFVSYLLLFRMRDPIALRTWCALLLPIFFGALLHVFMDTDLYPLSLSGFGQLWDAGQDLSCGGVAGGFLAILFTQLFSSIATAIIFMLLLILSLLGALHVTPEAVLYALREAIARRREARYYDNWDEDDDEYEYEETPPPPPPTPKRKRTIDLPVDDPPLVKEDEVQESPRRGWFNKAPKVQQPHEVLSAISRESDPVLPQEPVVTQVPIPDLESSPATPISVVESKPVVAPLVPSVSEVESPPSSAVAPKVATASAGGKPTAVAGTVDLDPRDLKKSERRELIREQQEEIAKNVATVLEAGVPVEYEYPSLNLLHEAVIPSQGAVQEELAAIQKRLWETISSFGIVSKITGAVRGPSITRYELELEQGTRLNKLTNLADDIALSLGASSVRIAPVPGKISLVGIEVPNQKITPVPIREVIGSETFEEHGSKVAFAVGKDIGGNYIIGDIAKLPHLLIAGTTGSGKSVCTNSLIISMLYKATPDEVRLIMVDPKMVELGIYNGIPHLLIPVVTDPKKAAGALQWAVVEMMKRYRMFSEVGVRDLSSYNTYAARTDGVDKLPQIVVVIDELADLMLVAAKEVEESICRVAQMGRASGMHLIIATQRPSADVITGLMKANIPSRIAFAVASSLESRIILDTQGAEKLVGKGDMLWFPLGSGKPLRVQGCLIDDQDVAAVVAFVKASGDVDYDEGVLQEIEQHAQEQGKGSKGAASASTAELSDGEGDYDELLDDAVGIVLELGQASVSMLQRRLKLGYSRAARLVDQMEDRGIVGPFEGSKPRQLLITREKWDALKGRPSGEEPTKPLAEPLPLGAALDEALLPYDSQAHGFDEEDLFETALSDGDMPPWNEEEV